MNDKYLDEIKKILDDYYEIYISYLEAIRSGNQKRESLKNRIQNLNTSMSNFFMQPHEQLDLQSKQVKNVLESLLTLQNTHDKLLRNDTIYMNRINEYSNIQNSLNTLKNTLNNEVEKERNKFDADVIRKISVFNNALGRKIAEPRIWVNRMQNKWNNLFINTQEQISEIENDDVRETMQRLMQVQEIQEELRKISRIIVGQNVPEARINLRSQLRQLEDELEPRINDLYLVSYELRDAIRNLEDIRTSQPKLRKIDFNMRKLTKLKDETNQNISELKKIISELKGIIAGRHDNTHRDNNYKKPPEPPASAALAVNQYEFDYSEETNTHKRKTDMQEPYHQNKKIRV